MAESLATPADSSSGGSPPQVGGVCASLVGSVWWRTGRRGCAKLVGMRSVW